MDRQHTAPPASQAQSNLGDDPLADLATPAARMRAVREGLGWTQQQMAQHLRISLRALQGYETNHLPKTKVLVQLCQQGFNGHWLLTGQGQALGPGAPLLHMPEIRLPVYDMAAPCAADGQLSSLPLLGQVTLGRQLLPESLTPQHLAVLRLHGDAMAPMLCQGDQVLVQDVAASPIQDGLYLIRLDHVLLVKQLQRIPQGLRVSSVNPSYAPFVVNEAAMGRGMQVLGRVIWHGRGL